MWQPFVDCIPGKRGNTDGGTGGKNTSGKKRVHILQLQVKCLISLPRY